jgi:hypothetical protein
MRKLTATMMCAVMLTTGCASAGRAPVTAGPGTAAPQAPVVEATAMADYVQRLPAGSKVRVERTDGSSMRGTLMKGGADAIVVQKNTRIPEAPVQVPVREIARVTVENGGGMSGAKAAAIGIASGVAAFFTILAIAFAAGSD